MFISKFAIVLTLFVSNPQQAGFIIYETPPEVKTLDQCHTVANNLIIATMSPAFSAVCMDITLANQIIPISVK